MLKFQSGTQSRMGLHDNVNCIPICFCAADPKSANLILPVDVTRILAPLMSLCAIPVLKHDAQLSLSSMIVELQETSKEKSTALLGVVGRKKL